VMTYIYTGLSVEQCMCPGLFYSKINASNFYIVSPLFATEELQ